MDLQASYVDIKYLKEHVDEVETENEQMREQRKKKAADITELCSRALELRLAARKALSNEGAVRSARNFSLRTRRENDLTRYRSA